MCCICIGIKLGGIIGVGTCCGLGGLEFESQWVQEIIFSVLIETGPGTHLVSFTMGSGCGVD